MDNSPLQNTPKFVSLAEMVEEQARRYPDRVAFVFEDDTGAMPVMDLCDAQSPVAYLGSVALRTVRRGRSSRYWFILPVWSLSLHFWRCACAGCLARAGDISQTSSPNAAA